MVCASLQSGGCIFLIVTYSYPSIEFHKYKGKSDFFLIEILSFVNAFGSGLSSWNGIGCV